MAIIKEFVGGVSKAVLRAGAGKECAVGRVCKAKVCAVEKMTVVQSFAAKRVQEAMETGRLVTHFTKKRVHIWLDEALEAHVKRVSRRNFNKMLYNMECEKRKLEYELSVREYQEWRLEQIGIAGRDIVERMHRLGYLTNIEFPVAARPSLYDVKPAPLPPKQLVIMSYRQYLKESHEKIGLFEGTVQLVTRPLRSVGTLLLVIGLLAEGFMEVRKPGSLRQQIRVLGKVLKLEGVDEADAIEPVEES